MEPMIGKENRPTAIDYDVPLSELKLRDLLGLISSQTVQIAEHIKPEKEHIKPEQIKPEYVKPEKEHFKPEKEHFKPEKEFFKPEKERFKGEILKVEKEILKVEKEFIKPEKEALKPELSKPEKEVDFGQVADEVAKRIAPALTEQITKSVIETLRQQGVIK